MSILSTIESKYIAITQHTYKKRTVFLLSAVVGWIVLSSGLSANSTAEWQTESWSEPFNYESPTSDVLFQRTEQPTRRWHLCIAYPHLKDAYWLNVNYGMVEEASFLGVNFSLVEAGGYPNLERQREQILECTSRGADALILGTVSFKGLEQEVLAISKKMPVLATVNDISDPGITAKAGVSWTDMGRVSGEFVSNRHPSGSPKVKVAWFPGPKGAGWVDFIERGFREGIKDSSVDVVVTKWGDTGKEIQRTLVQEALESNPDIDYIVGNALTAEAAISILRQHGKNNKIKIISTYLTPAVYRGIRRGRILAAPTDAPVLQGRISINQAVRILEGRPFRQHIGPKIRMISEDNIDKDLIEDSLAPPTFSPSFVLENE